MIILIALGLLWIGLVFVAVVAILASEEGSEDKTGFHAGKQS